jgi:hypothetical protein
MSFLILIFALIGFINKIHPTNNLHTFSIILKFQLDTSSLEEERQILLNSIKSETNTEDTPQIREITEPLARKSAAPHEEAFDMYKVYKKTPHSIHELINLNNKIVSMYTQGLPYIHAYYKGWSNISNQNGIISFPREEIEQEILLLFATDINPLLLKTKVPSFFTIENEENYKLYRIKANIQEDNNILWTCTEEKLLNKEIPSNTIIIFVNPKYISIQENNKTPFTENILIPPIFIKREATLGKYALKSMDINRFYEDPKMLSATSTINPNHTVTTSDEKATSINNQP